MEYELFHPADCDQQARIPFVVSLSGSGQTHVNGFSQRLRSKNWAVAVPLRPSRAPGLYDGNGSQGDGIWHVWEFCKHLLSTFAVENKKFLMVGVSNGGSSVLRFATLWPELCCGLVAVTGSLQGLVKLPEDLKQLNGIPIDMYVGSNDECGFYQPMQKMMADLRAIGHEPAASLTVFQGGGHICSPLIEDCVIHSKLLLFLLRTGNLVTSKTIAISAKSVAHGDPHRVLALLKDFCGDLGLRCTLDSKGSLKVCSAASSVPVVSIVSEAASDTDAVCAINFKVDDAVELWCNSQQAWIRGTVSKIVEHGDIAGVTVTFTDSRGKVSKTIPPGLIRAYVRTPGSKTKISSTTLVVGDRVAVWSDSKQSWFEDGEVTELRSNMITIRYCNNELVKDVPIDQIQSVIKELPIAQTIAAGDSSSNQPANPEAKLTDVSCPANFVVGDHVSVWSDSLQKWFEDGEITEVDTEAVIIRYDHGAVLKQISHERVHLFVKKTHSKGQVCSTSDQTTSASQASQSCPTNLVIGDRVTVWSQSMQSWFEDGEVVEVNEEEAIIRYDNGAAGKRIPFDEIPLLVRKIKPIELGADGTSDKTKDSKAAESNEDSKCSNVSCPVNFVVGDPVAVWSGSSQSWFEDGNVTKVTTDGVTVTYDSGTTGKEVPIDMIPQFIRKMKPSEVSANPVSEKAVKEPKSVHGLSISGLAVFVVGDPVAVWSGSSQSWFEDGSITKVTTESVTVTYDSGATGKEVPIDMVPQFIRQMKPSQVSANPLPEKAIKDFKPPRLSDKDQVSNISGLADVVVGDPVAVWSTSSQSWFEDGQVTDVTTEAVTVTYDKGIMCKNVPCDLLPHLIKRKDQPELGGHKSREGEASEAKRSSISCPANFVLGDRVAVWSESSQAWFEDGEVTEMSAEAVTVTYDKGITGKEVPFDMISQLIKKMESHKLQETEYT